VDIIGDGTQKKPKIISNVNDFNIIQAAGVQAGGSHMQRTIKDCRKDLEEKMKELGENGQTALGPAVLSAIGLAG
jgi:hypothetical protein